MSDEVNSGGAGRDEGGAQVDDSLTKPERDYKSDMLKFKDMLNDSRNEVSQLRRMLEDRDIEMAKSEGDKDKVIQSLQERLESTEKRLKGSTYNYARTNIESEIKTRAMQKNCNDAELLIKFIGDDKIGKVTVDANYKPDGDEIELLIDEAMKNTGHINLFGKKVNVADVAPSNKPIEKNESKSVQSMSNDDLMNALKSLPNEKRIADL